MHYHILNHREMYGLPRKFNIAFDGGGAVSALEDTNDIGFTAVRVGDGGRTVPAGIYFRLQAGRDQRPQGFRQRRGSVANPGPVRPGRVRRCPRFQ